MSRYILFGCIGGIIGGAGAALFNLSLPITATVAVIVAIGVAGFAQKAVAAERDRVKI